MYVKVILVLVVVSNSDHFGMCYVNVQTVLYIYLMHSTFFVVKHKFLDITYIYVYIHRAKPS